MNLPTKEAIDMVGKHLAEECDGWWEAEHVAALLRAIASGDLVVCAQHMSFRDSYNGGDSYPIYTLATSIPEPKT